MKLVKVRMLKATPNRKKDEVVEVDELRAKTWIKAKIAKAVK